MGRLSIEISEREHQRIKALAALSGVSIKDYILERTLADDKANASETQALAQLQKLLEPRVAAAERGEYSALSISQIASLARQRRKT